MKDISIYIKLLVCVFVCVSRFVRHTTNIKGRGFRCYGNGTGDVGVRVVGLLPSNPQSTPSHPVSVTTDQYHDKLVKLVISWFYFASKASKPSVGARIYARFPIVCR